MYEYSGNFFLEDSSGNTFQAGSGGLYLLVQRQQVLGVDEVVINASSCMAACRCS